MKYEHILWCRDEKANSDKVWGIILIAKVDTFYNVGIKVNTYKYVTFWGRRGKALQTKIWEGGYWDVDDMKRKKLNKGYQEVDKQRLDEVYPEFEQDLEKTAVWAMLGA
jgi:hypothetical protein